MPWPLPQKAARETPWHQQVPRSQSERSHNRGMHVHGGYAKAQGLSGPRYWAITDFIYRLSTKGVLRVYEGVFQSLFERFFSPGRSAAFLTALASFEASAISDAMRFKRATRGDRSYSFDVLPPAL